LLRGERISGKTQREKKNCLREVSGVSETAYMTGEKERKKVMFWLEDGENQV